MTQSEIEIWKLKIDKMTHVEMARLWRFSPIGHPLFQEDNEAYHHFKDKFAGFGGFTTAVSKEIGW